MTYPNLSLQDGDTSLVLDHNLSGEFIYTRHVGLHGLEISLELLTKINLEGGLIVTVRAYEDDEEYVLLEIIYPETEDSCEESILVNSLPSIADARVLMALLTKSLSVAFPETTFTSVDDL